MPQEDAGLGLEYGLQSLLSPLANASRRTSAGSWRAVDWTSSRSRGARAYQQLGELFSTVKDVWARAACWRPGDDPLPGGCHVVFPAELLQQHAPDD
jgi:hypothetical protein